MQHASARRRRSLPPLIATLCAAALLAGCQNAEKPTPDYNRQLPPGASALRKLVSPADWPDLASAFDRRDEQLTEALDRSVTWYANPSSQRHFPMYDVTHTRAEASAFALRTLLEEARTGPAFEQAVQDQFDCYTSVGYDDRGTVLFTGYYTPVFKASRTRTERYRYPLYRKPPDLEIDPLSGEVHGRRTPQGVIAYPSRRTLEGSDLLDGLEIAYLPSRFDQYIIHVNGSAKLELTDGSVMHVGYAGNNGHEYTGLGKTLIEEGVFAPEELSLPAIREHFRDREHELERYINMNDRFVFFTEYDGANWPAGSLGVQVTERRSLATDNDVFPRGAPVLVETQIPTLTGSQESFLQIMADQDTGGAIRAAGRGDIYMGIGVAAERLAGRQFSEGRLYYLFLNHDHVLTWQRRLQDEADSALASRPPAD